MLLSSTKLVLLVAALSVAKCVAKDVYYEWTIKPRLAASPLSPDCFVDRDLLLVDGQFPGPDLIANVGDTVYIKWINQHPSEAVSIHYHGNLMNGQPYADGTGGISTCVVGPMQTFMHTFVADNAGTHYWHGHTSMDRMDGLQGIMIIDDPDNEDEVELKAEYDEEQVIFLQDWYHKAGPYLRTSLDSGVFIGLPQSILVNGKGRFGGCVEDPSLPGCDEEGCSAEDYIAPIPVEEGKTYLFRIINAGGLISLNFAIAGHNMTVVKADGTFVEPFEVSSLEINVAQRYDVLVTADKGEELSYWAAVQGPRGLMGYAYLQYGNSTPPNENSTMPEHLVDGPAVDSMLFSKNVGTQPNAAILNATPDRSSVLVTAQALLPGVGFLYTSNNVSNSMSPYAGKPLITLAYEAVNAADATPWPDTVIPGTVEVPDYAPVVWNFSAPPGDQPVNMVFEDHGQAVYKFVEGEVVEMVFQNTVGNRGSAGSHGWHVHGHEFYVVGQGEGTFDPETDPASYNLVNPVLRDTFSVWDYGWTAIRFVANNPGVWPFHCTILPHSVQGMGFTIVTSPDMLSAPPPGLESCYQTSVNPADAQVCTLLADSDAAVVEKSGSEEDKQESDVSSGVTSSVATSGFINVVIVAGGILGQLLN